MKKQSEPSGEKAGRAAAEPRVWRDRTGRFSIEATLLGLSGDKVRLVRVDDGKTIELSLDALSEEDQQICRQLAASSSPATSGSEERDEIPAWERLFRSRSDELDAAILGLDRSLLRITTAADTTLVVEQDFVRAWRDFLKSVRGTPLRVHYKLADVRQGRASKDLPRGQTAIELQLADPTFACDAYSNEITVAANAAEARALRTGAIVQLDGQFMLRSRRTFGSMRFIRRLPSSREYRESLTLSRARALNDSASLLLNARELRGEEERLDDYWTVTLIFYVESLRVLTGKSLDEYHAFLAREKGSPRDSADREVDVSIEGVAAPDGIP